MVWLILALLLWGIIHSLLASLKAKELVLRWAGAGVLRFYRLFYNAFAILSFVPILVIVALTKSATLYTVPFPWSYLMILGEFLAIIVLGLGLLQTDPWEFIGLSQLGNASKQARLNTAGLYRYVRHPLYVAGLVFIWLVPHMTVTLCVFNIALTIYIIIGAFFEERKLRYEFGQEYIDYAAATPMLIPFTKRKKLPALHN